jgi:hypothetical protein
LPTFLSRFCALFFSQLPFSIRDDFTKTFLQFRDEKPNTLDNKSPHSIIGITKISRSSTKIIISPALNHQLPTKSGFEFLLDLRLNRLGIFAQYLA